MWGLGIIGISRKMNNTRNRTGGQSLSISYFWSREFLSKRSILWFFAHMQHPWNDLWIHMVWGSNGRYRGSWLAMAGHIRTGQPDGQLILQFSASLCSFTRLGAWGSLFQQFIEALAVVTSVKYGIWAVAIIFAGQAQGMCWHGRIGCSLLHIRPWRWKRYCSYDCFIIAGQRSPGPSHGHC